MGGGGGGKGIERIGKWSVGQWRFGSWGPLCGFTLARMHERRLCMSLTYLTLPTCCSARLLEAGQVFDGVIMVPLTDGVYSMMWWGGDGREGRMYVCTQIRITGHSHSHRGDIHA
jgi:hypothetical protein